MGSITSGRGNPATQRTGVPSPEPVIYLPDRLVVRVLDSIDRRVGYALADEIEHGASYYGYQRFDIHLDSPGGDATALAYLVDRVQEWKSRGLVIGTLGLGTVASAAAILLSIGSPGYRRVCPHSTLLYHSPRVTAPTRTGWTAEALESAAFSLARSERLVLDALLRMTGDPRQQRARRKRLKALLEEERWLTPIEAALDYDLIDYIRR